MNISDFEIGKVYKRDDLISAFGGSFMRGMNICKKTNTLVLISKHTKHRQYGDQLSNNSEQIVYTGEGLKGDQTMTGANKALYYARENNIPVHLFVVFKETQYTYYGLVNLSDEPYFDIENDIEGKPRKVIRFNLVRNSAYALLTESEMLSQYSTGSVTPMEKPVYQVVGAAILDEDGKILCAQRGYGSLMGKWEFPGGKIEPGESDKEALKREIKEELNIDIEVYDLVDESYNEYKDFNVNLKVYKCKQIGGQIKDEEHQALKWSSVEELEDIDWADADKPIVESYLDSLPAKIDDEVHYDYFQAEAVKKSDRELVREVQDYEKSQRAKQRSGNAAELAVLLYERSKLDNIGRPDLADKVRQVSKESSDLGYDVLSFEVVEGGLVKEVHIEVKSAKVSNKYIEFFISENELNKFKNDDRHRIYCLFKVGRNYKLHEVNKTNFFNNNYLTPMTYRVRIRVAE